MALRKRSHPFNRFFFFFFIITPQKKLSHSPGNHTDKIPDCCKAAPKRGSDKTANKQVLVGLSDVRNAGFNRTTTITPLAEKRKIKPVLEGEGGEGG